MASSSPFAHSVDKDAASIAVDDGEFYEDDDDDVFAFGPPTTADGARSIATPSSTRRQRSAKPPTSAQAYLARVRPSMSDGTPGSDSRNLTPASSSSPMQKAASAAAAARTPPSRGAERPMTADAGPRGQTSNTSYTAYTGYTTDSGVPPSDVFSRGAARASKAFQFEDDRAGATYDMDEFQSRTSYARDDYYGNSTLPPTADSQVAALAYSSATDAGGLTTDAEFPPSRNSLRRRSGDANQILAGAAHSDEGKGRSSDGGTDEADKRHDPNAADSYMDVDEEDSPYPEVRASVSNIDDPDMPVNTFRAWFLGLTFCCVAAGMNIFFYFRYPSPSVTPLVVQLLSYPAGKFLAWILPTRDYYLPDWLGGWSFSLNPGGFNIKEHTLITIMATIGLAPVYSLNVVVAENLYFGANLGLGFTFLLVLSSQMFGLGFAGLCRRFLVWPAAMLWPQALVVSTLLNTFHAENDGQDGSMTRYKYLGIVSAASFFWYFLPGYLFTGLSAFSYICWIFPTNIKVNQLFGVYTGLGMGVLTFDWAQISYIGSPLVIPWWAEVNIAVGFVFFFWIVTPILYYTNTWSFAYLPMSATSAFDRFGKHYNISGVAGADGQINLEAYAAYSPLYLPATFAVTYFVAFMGTTAILVHTALYHGKALWAGFRRARVEDDDIHSKLMRTYPEAPDWWYLVVVLLSIGMAIVAIEVWHTGMPIYALLLSIAVPFVYLLPAGFIFAMTNQFFSVNLMAEIIPGYMLEGKQFPNLIFKAFSVSGLLHALYFTQDLKLGHYLKIPPRTTFKAQSIAVVLSSIVQILVKEWTFANIPGICSPMQPNNFTCPTTRAYFSAAIVWGVIGPRRQFGSGTTYHPELYALLIGCLLPIPFFFWCRKYPRSVFRNLNWPVLLTGIGFIPPATGINYASWIVTGSIFQFFLRRRHFRWWAKFNYLTSAALDSGTIIGTIFIFFALSFPKNGSIVLDWWGNNVWQNTYDVQGVPLLNAPATGFGPTSWPL